MSSAIDLSKGGINLAQLESDIPRLRSFARSLTRDEAASDDLVQDCLERALLKSHLFDGENLSAWLTTMCRRIFLNSIREKRILKSAISIDLVDQRAIVTAAPQEDILFLRQVLFNLGQLPLSDQRIIGLAARDGLQYADIAEELKIDIGTVRSRLSRARSRLRQSMKHPPDLAHRFTR